MFYYFPSRQLNFSNVSNHFSDGITVDLWKSINYTVQGSTLKKTNTLVFEGCCNKIPSIGWLINKIYIYIYIYMYFFFMVLETGSLVLSCQNSCLMVRALFQVADWSLFLSSHVGKRVIEFSDILLIKALIPFMKNQPSWPKGLTS